jgi:hypothetical protein
LSRLNGYRDDENSVSLNHNTAFSFTSHLHLFIYFFFFILIFFLVQHPHPLYNLYITRHHFISAFHLVKNTPFSPTFVLHSLRWFIIWGATPPHTFSPFFFSAYSHSSTVGLSYSHYTLTFVLYVAFHSTPLLTTFTPLSQHIVISMFCPGYTMHFTLIWLQPVALDPSHTLLPYLYSHLPPPVHRITMYSPYHFSNHLHCVHNTANHCVNAHLLIHYTYFHWTKAFWMPSHMWVVTKLR